MKLLFFLLLSSIVGMPMALEYPWSYEVHQTIVIFSTLALAIMIYGIFRRKSRLGKVLFLLGFLLWSGIGLFFGLSTGT
ncbi:hypothetical protein MNB_SV-13-2078 [hydrothermal vent metagenome]|uniref:Uncharacterized protein n=1 Tax=hydrothermal vent metagenome TaxID=652676 RepID=A0A1W1BRI4_9ZZZZ